MKTPVVFLLLLGVAFARGDTTPDKVNQLEAKNVHQIIKPSSLETAATRTGDLQLSNMQYQTNRMESYHQPQPQQHSQLQNSQQSLVQNEADQFFNSQNYQNPPAQGRDQQQQEFRRQNQAPYQNPAQFRFQQSGQTVAPLSSDQEVTGFLQSQTKEQGRDFSQQLYPESIRPQQEFYQDRRRLDVHQDPSSSDEKRFADASDRNGFHSLEMRTGGSFPEVFRQRSAFENRGHPIVVPGVSQTHSTSVVVSGLKSLPVLPALVYSAGTVPKTVAYGRPVFQGAAFVKQHWQTPYARYVYSHIL